MRSILADHEDRVKNLYRAGLAFLADFMDTSREEPSHERNPIVTTNLTSGTIPGPPEPPDDRTWHGRLTLIVADQGGNPKQVAADCGLKYDTFRTWVDGKSVPSKPVSQLEVCLRLHERLTSPTTGEPYPLVWIAFGPDMMPDDPEVTRQYPRELVSA